MKSIQKRRVLVVEDEKPMTRAFGAKSYFVKPETSIMKIVKIIQKTLS